MSEELIRLVNISKEYDGEKVLDQINLYILRNEFLTLLGPSGCGKTTTLRLIGGFESPTSGDVLFNGKPMQDLPPFKRKVNTVFQRYALFPHMNVFDNVAFGLKIKKMDKKSIEMKVNEMLELVNLPGFGKRAIDSLSGGQQQRVAIARSLVTEPKIIFADEPTGNLDTKTTIEILSFLQQIVRKRQCTLIMVSHDLEVAQYADRIIHMRDGKVIKITEGEAAIKELTKAEEIIENLPDIEEPKTESPQSAQEKEPEAEKAKILNEEDTEEKR
mgnify:CR=1 FL=1